MAKAKKSPAGAVEEAQPLAAAAQDPAPAVASKPLGDLHETVVEVRAELAAEAKTARYTREGVLLNPEDFNVAGDGTLTPRS